MNHHRRLRYRLYEVIAPLSAGGMGEVYRLAGLGVLELAFAQRIAASAGLRKRIVHEYDEIDHRRVLEALRGGACQRNCRCVQGSAVSGSIGSMKPKRWKSVSRVQIRLIPCSRISTAVCVS